MYNLDLLQTTYLLEAKLTNTPMDHNHKTTFETYPSLTNPTYFRNITGKLLYLTHTKPDISFSICRLSQFLSKPKEAHFEEALRILQYIKYAPR